MKNTGNSDASAISGITDPEIPVATLVDDGIASNSSPTPTRKDNQGHASHQEQQTLVGNRQQSDPFFTRFPMINMVCPECHQESRSKVRSYPAWQTWTAAGLTFLLFWPLCWVPLVLESCKRSDHYCNSCGAKVGSVAPFEDCCVSERG
eukprot:scaffold781_cov132-Cylindrotheca_fusiformis.AAC.28